MWNGSYSLIRLDPSSSKLRRALHAWSPCAVTPPYELVTGFFSYSAGTGDMQMSDETGRIGLFVYKTHLLGLIKWSRIAYFEC